MNLGSGRIQKKMELDAKEIFKGISTYPQPIQIGIVAALIRQIGAGNAETEKGRKFFRSEPFIEWQSRNSPRIQALTSTEMEKLTKFGIQFVRKYSVYGYPEGGTLVKLDEDQKAKKFEEYILSQAENTEKRKTKAAQEQHNLGYTRHCTKPSVVSRQGSMGLRCLKKHDWACVHCNCGNHSTHNFDNCWCYC